jgi:hypothetical protein
MDWMRHNYAHDPRAATTQPVTWTDPSPALFLKLCHWCKSRLHRTTAMQRVTTIAMHPRQLYQCQPPGCRNGTCAKYKNGGGTAAHFPGRRPASKKRACMVASCVDVEGTLHQGRRNHQCLMYSGSAGALSTLAAAMRQASIRNTDTARGNPPASVQSLMG